MSYPARAEGLVNRITKFGRLAKIWWSVCISKSQCTLCVSFSRTDSGLCIYHLSPWSNFSFLQKSLLIPLPTQSCLVLYYFWANFLHSLSMWLIIITSSFSFGFLQTFSRCFTQDLRWGKVMILHNLGINDFVAFFW